MKPETEEQFQRAIVQLASLLGWDCYHTWSSIHSTSKGFPDLVLCRPPELFYAELKSQSGKVSDSQRKWLDSLIACGVEAYLWRPSDWPDIVVRLKEAVCP